MIERAARRVSKEVCFAVCCSVLQRVAVCCSVLQRVAGCCSVYQGGSGRHCAAHQCVSTGMLQCVAVCVAVCCSAL